MDGVDGVLETFKPVGLAGPSDRECHFLSDLIMRLIWSMARLTLTESPFIIAAVKESASSSLLSLFLSFQLPKEIRTSQSVVILLITFPFFPIMRPTNTGLICIIAVTSKLELLVAADLLDLTTVGTVMDCKISSNIDTHLGLGVDPLKFTRSNLDPINLSLRIQEFLISKLANL